MSIDLINGKNDQFCFIHLHYTFSDDSHAMDAFLQNKCEHAFLSLLRAIAKTTRAQITVEVEPHLEGGLISRYKIRQLKPRKKSKISDSVRTALLTAIFLAPTTISINGINEIIKAAVSKHFEDPVTDSLEKDKLRLEIEKLHLEINNERKTTTEDNQLDKQSRENDVTLAIKDFRMKLIRVDSNKSANLYRFRFYQELAKYGKINSFSTQVINAGYLDKTEEFVIQKSDIINIGTDISTDLKRLDRAINLLGEDSDIVQELKVKISKKISNSKKH